MFPTAFWQFIYNCLLVPALWLLTRLLALFKPKIRRAIRGRRNIVPKLRDAEKRFGKRQRIWIHASSMGEFEQAKPLIEALKADAPDIAIIATFFSPSGFENNQRYQFADHISYLPFDNRSAVRAFLDAAQPSLVAFIRYDVWPNCVWECERRGIPSMLVNATLGGHSSRLWPVLRSFHRAMYNPLRTILTVSETDAQNFSRLKLASPQIHAIGDTRFDRVKMKAETARKKKLLPAAITEGKKIFVVGSCWSEDEEVVLPVLLTMRKYVDNLLTILVPHEPTLENIELLEYKLESQVSSIRFSYLADYTNEEVIIVDSIGVLLSLYANAHVAFVGGGFKTNVHNVLEPAVYGIPVLYGPKIANSQEAFELSEYGGGFIVQDHVELYRHMRTFIDDEAVRTDAGVKAERFVTARTGATREILSHVLPLLRDGIIHPSNTN